MANAPIQSITFTRDSTEDILHNSSSGSGSGSSDVPTPVAHTYVGDRLYGWTNPGETYYAWKLDYADKYYYTLSQVPSSGDKVYEKIDGSIVETTEYVGLSQYDSSTNPPRVKIYDLADSDWYYRDTTEDIVGDPQTVYTASTTLTTGMLLYDNTGTDTGLMIGTVNQDGTFDVGTQEITFELDNTFISNIVLDGITYTSDFTTKLSEGNHSLIINGDYVSSFISSNQGYSVTVINGVTNSAPSNGSLNISSTGSVTETTQNYYLGTCPITLTINGSYNSGGGSN